MNPCMNPLYEPLYESLFEPLYESLYESSMCINTLVRSALTALKQLHGAPYRL